MNIRHIVLLVAVVLPLAAHAQKIAVPAYFEPPSAQWTRMENGYHYVGLVVANPGDGPGSAKSFAYENEIQKSHNVGEKVIGYVNTDFYNPLPANVAGYIDAWFRWYNIDGIFLDCAASDPAYLPGYQQLAQSIAAAARKYGRPTPMIVLNHGTNPDEAYVRNTNFIVVNYEDSYLNYRKWQPAAWVWKYPANRFWHIVHTTPIASLMLDVVKKSKNRNAGWVYVTNDLLPNPYDQLPSGNYWSQELGAVAQ